MIAQNAPAKLNLGLHVLRRLADGYHDIDTILLPIGWHDRLEVRPASDLSLSCSDPSLPTDERNLVMKAALSLRAWASRVYPDRVLGASMHLEKNVPHGAGLGGGSSDAAQALRMLAAMWQLEVPPLVLHELAAGLGSDVPFFLYDRPMRATGRGTDLEPVCDAEGVPWVFPFALVVAMPPVQVSTAGAYRLVTPSDEHRPDLREVVTSGDLDRWRGALVNDFEAPVAARHPPIAALKSALLAAGAGYAAMSGSGAAVFGVFASLLNAQVVAEELRAEGLAVWAG